MSVPRRSAGFVKQRRDVELVDAEQRPVGEAAPMGLGLLASTDHVTMGILRLQPGVAKSYSETRDHDMVRAQQFLLCFLDTGCVMRLAPGLVFSVSGNFTLPWPSSRFRYSLQRTTPW